MVVCGATKVSLLGHNAVLPDCDPLYIIKCSIVPDPGIVSNSQFPGKGNVNTRTDQNVPSHFRPKESECNSAPWIQNLRCTANKERFEYEPKLHEPRWPSSLTFGDAKPG